MTNITPKNKKGEKVEKVLSHGNLAFKSFREKPEKKIAVVRGIGAYYGIAKQVPVLKIDKDEQVVQVLLDGKKEWFSTINGFSEHRNAVLYTTYQLDLSSLIEEFQFQYYV